MMSKVDGTVWSVQTDKISFHRPSLWLQGHTPVDSALVPGSGHWKVEGDRMERPRF